MGKFVGIIDFSNTFHKAYHVLAYEYKRNEKELDLNNSKDRAAFIRKLVINLYNVTKETYAQQIILCFDNGSFRKELYPEYKGQRKEKPPGFDECIEICYNLYKTKVGTLRVPFLEADDLMILAAESEMLEKMWKILVTADEDARASLKKNIFAYDPTHGRKTTFSSYPLSASLLSDASHKVVDPHYILFMKLARGCVSDNIERIVPRGTRETKLQIAYENWKENGLDPDVLVKSFTSANIKVDEERTKLQFRLVDLNPRHLPEGKYEEWKAQMNDLIESDYEDFYISKILSNTPYYGNY